jgi:hypothetical protein
MLRTIYAEGIPFIRAAAALWTRLPGGEIFAEDVCDFGTLPITQEMRQMFATEEAGLLPAVETQRWDTRRHVPVPTDHPDLPQTHIAWEYVIAISDYVAGRSGWDETGALYGGVRPTIRVDGARLQEGLPPGSPPVEDFVLDLGHVYSTVMRAVTPDQLSKARANDTCS